MPRKTTDSDVKKFACRKCGIGIAAPPPDSSFKYAYISECKEESDEDNHNYKQFYACLNCDEGVSLYWCQGHFHVASTGHKVIGHDDPFTRKLRERYDM